SRTPDLTQKVYICIYNSCNCLKKLENIDTIIIDEGHHLDGDRTGELEEAADPSKKKDDMASSSSGAAKDLRSYKRGILSMTARRRFFFSATLDSADNDDIDFRFDTEQAINSGYLSDYDIIIPVFENGMDIKQGLITLLSDRLDLQYVLAYCNNRQSGQDFTMSLKN